jgi:xanthine dehydrogenase YagR molybdenum-binding subunit
MAEMRSERFPFGIASIGLGEVTRQVPADEPSPLTPNAELAVIGKSIPRQNGRAKVTGATRFTTDISLPGMLHGRILRSPHPHAQVQSIDVSAAASYPGVYAILVVARPNDPAESLLRYVGQPVLAVAAKSATVADEALRHVKVDYKPLPFVVDLDKSRQPQAPLVFEAAFAPGGDSSGYPAPTGLPLNGNIRGPLMSHRGDLDQGFAQADIVLEAEYSTRVQTHCCMESHGVVADWRSDGLTIYMSTQFTAGVRRELAEAFDLPMSRVRVVVDGMGGGFGSKTTLGNYARFAVALSRDARAPVRLCLDRDEEQVDSGNRPAVWQRIRLGARRDGTLSALAIESYGTAGVALGAGVGNFAEGLYRCANFQSAQNDVFTNASPGCAMRAPGNTPGAFGLEQTIDELAERLNIDPLVLRDRIDPSPVRREERRIGAQRIGWDRRHASGTDAGRVKRGIGMAQSFWNANVQVNASCEVRILRDGSVEILSSVQDIGTGISTVLAQTVGEVLGLAPGLITVRIGDTDFPAGPPSHGSRTTASITPPARTAAWRVLKMLFRVAASRLNAAADDLAAKDGRIFVRDNAARSIAFAEAAALMRADQISAIESRADDYEGFLKRMGDAALAKEALGGVQFAEVSVDTDTGIVGVERVVAVHDCGRPMNPRQVESQIHGGVLMGLSYALYEERILDPHTGRMVNANLEQYKLAGPVETPDIEVVTLENYQGRSATDAYGIAEPANISTAPAIANAIYNAIGLRLRSLPMTPATILAALGKVPTRS